MKKFFLGTLAIVLGFFTVLAVGGYWIYWYNNVRWTDLPASLVAYHQSDQEDKHVWSLNVRVENRTSDYLSFNPKALVRGHNGAILATDFTFFKPPENGWRLAPGNSSELLLNSTSNMWPDGLPTKSESASEEAQRARVVAFVETFDWLTGVLLIDEHHRLRADIDLETKIQEWRKEFGLAEESEE